MNFRLIKSLLLFGFLCFCSISVIGQSNENTIYRFLDIPPNASVAALGGFHSGLFNGDFSSMHLNPAYLFGAKTGEISATFVNYLADSKMGVTNGTFRINEYNQIGVGVRFMGYGNFSNLDENGNNLGNFSATDIAIAGVYAAQLIPNWSGGLGLDFIHSSYSQYKSSALAVSGGVYYKNIDSHFSFGATVRNLGTQLSTFNDVREPMPLDVSVGITKKPQGFPAEVSFTLRRLNDWDLRTFAETEKPAFFENAFRHVVLGGTFDLSENFHFRLGYNRYLHELNRTKENFDFAGVGVGVGFNVKKLIIDISRNSYSETGGIVQFSIKTSL